MDACICFCSIFVRQAALCEFCSMFVSGVLVCRIRHAIENYSYYLQVYSAIKAAEGGSVLFME